MIHVIRLLLLAGAVIGLFGQVQARVRLPQPAALAEKAAALAGKAADGCAETMDGMEPPSDLLGEAALTEVQERLPCDGNLLDCISIKGWALSAVAGDVLRLDPPAVPASPPPVAQDTGRTPWRLARREPEPPRA